MEPTNKIEFDPMDIIIETKDSERTFENVSCIEVVDTLLVFKDPAKKIVGFVNKHEVISIIEEE